MKKNIFRFTLAILIGMVVLMAFQAVAHCLEAITLKVSPMQVMVNPYKKTEFTVKIRIEPNENNRRWSYAATCGSEEIYSQGDIHPTDRPTREKKELLAVVSSCIFVACVHRLENGKVKNYCAEQVVQAGGGP